MKAAHLVVDAMNVIGSRPNGWWRDRDAAVRRLVERLQWLAAADGCGVTLVVDGRPLGDLPEGAHGGVEVLYASRVGRNAADDRIVAFIAGHADPGSLDVVTSDRELAARVRARGAGARGVRGLLERLDEVGELAAGRAANDEGTAVRPYNAISWVCGGRAQRWRGYAQNGEGGLQSPLRRTSVS